MWWYSFSTDFSVEIDEGSVGGSVNVEITDCAEISILYGALFWEIVRIMRG